MKLSKAECVAKANQGVDSLLPIGGQIFSHFQESWDSSHLTVTWKDKYHNSKHSPFLLLSSCFYCWAWHHLVWNIPLVSLGQLSWLCPLSSSYALPASLLRSRNDCLSISTAHQYLRYQCVISTVSVPNSNIIQAAMKKMNSIPAKAVHPYAQLLSHLIYKNIKYCQGRIFYLLCVCTTSCVVKYTTYWQWLFSNITIYHHNNKIYLTERAVDSKICSSLTLWNSLSRFLAWHVRWMFCSHSLPATKTVLLYS